MAGASWLAVVMNVLVPAVVAIITAILTARAVVKGGRQQSIETESIRLRHAMAMRRLEQFDQACEHFLATISDEKVGSTAARDAAGAITRLAPLVSGEHWDELREQAMEFYFCVDEWLDQRDGIESLAPNAKEGERMLSYSRRSLQTLRRRIERIVAEAAGSGGD